MYAVWNPSVHFITSACWSHRIVSSFAVAGRKRTCMTEISCKQLFWFRRCAGKNNLDFVQSLVVFGISNISYCISYPNVRCSNTCLTLPLTTKHLTKLMLDLNFRKLTGGNWQKWKRVFLTCPCHEIYRDEAVGLKSCKYTWKITIYVNMWNLG